MDGILIVIFAYIFESCSMIVVIFLSVGASDGEEVYFMIDVQECVPYNAPNSFARRDILSGGVLGVATLLSAR